MTVLRLQDNTLSFEMSGCDDDNEKSPSVEKDGNHIWFYSSVLTEDCLTTAKQLRELDQKLRAERVSRDLPDYFDPVPIWLHVQSTGGDAYSALALVDQIKHIKTPVYSIVEGICGSAATLLSMACKRRFITPSSFMLIHQASGFLRGTYSQMKDDTKMADMLMETLRLFYIHHSAMDDKTVRKVLSHESWFDAGEAVKHGLVDEVLV